VTRPPGRRGGAGRAPRRSKGRGNKSLSRRMNESSCLVSAIVFAGLPACLIWLVAR
jgi:hypothetical protein